jgi:transcriptional regulator with XRE-family HTH domain
MASLQQPEVSELIREIRSRTGLTQEQLAVRIGVVFTTLSKWERGKANPLPLALKRLRRCFRAWAIAVKTSRAVFPQTELSKHCPFESPKEKQ